MFVMKIRFFTNNNIQNSKQNATFQGGMTPQIMQKIQSCNVAEISSKLADKNIKTDFQDNKMIAWCCDKVVDIFEQMNKKFHTKLDLPTEINVEDFAKLNSINEGSIGLCNMFPAKMYKGSDNISAGKSVFFNTFDSMRAKLPPFMAKYLDWNNIEQTSDYMFLEKNASTNHFLYSVLHEFSHAAHEGNLIKKLGAKDLPYFVYEHNSKDYMETFKGKYKDLAKTTCNYAGVNPFETIACDLPRVILSAVDKDLNLVKNPLKGTPYQNYSKFKENFFSKNLDPQKSYFELVRNFWNGKMD